MTTKKNLSDQVSKQDYKFKKTKLLGKYCKRQSDFLIQTKLSLNLTCSFGEFLD
jgi:hypothetical protein